MLTLAAVFAVASSVALVLGVLADPGSKRVLTTRDAIAYGEEQRPDGSMRGRIVPLEPGDFDPRD